MRLFFGLSLPHSVRERTAQCARLAEARLAGRYALADNHHITLAFLGNVDEVRVPEAAQVLRDVIAGFPAPQITVGDYAFFGPESRAILILQAKTAPDIAPLHDALTAALAANDLPFDSGPFAPHITLARRVALTQGDLSALNAAHPASGLSFACPQAHVFLSARDGKNILRYTPLVSCFFHS